MFHLLRLRAFDLKGDPTRDRLALILFFFVVVIIVVVVVVLDVLDVVDVLTRLRPMTLKLLLLRRVRAAVVAAAMILKRVVARHLLNDSCSFVGAAGCCVADCCCPYDCSFAAD